MYIYIYIYTYSTIRCHATRRQHHTAISFELQGQHNLNLCQAHGGQYCAKKNKVSP